jgi:hypothetical protein
VDIAAFTAGRVREGCVVIIGSPILHNSCVHPDLAHDVDVDWLLNRYGCLSRFSVRLCDVAEVLLEGLAES